MALETQEREPIDGKTSRSIRDAVGDGAEAVVAVEARELVGEAHLVELVDGPGREAVTAGLDAREALLLDDHHVVAMVVEDSVRNYEFRPVIDRWMVNVTMMQTISIGAGGGSIASIDSVSKRLSVGPRSAGSMPGPACYDLGGSEPTVTDADVVLGYISPEAYFGGQMPLNKAKAERAIREKIAEPLGMFSANGIAAITLIFGFSRARARITAIVAAAPDMSSFIVSIHSACLIERPPESNVMPFPVIAYGFAEPAPV